jgi:hypothetical protein
MKLVVMKDADDGAIWIRNETGGIDDACYFYFRSISGTIIPCTDAEKMANLFAAAPAMKAALEDILQSDVVGPFWRKRGRKALDLCDGVVSLSDRLAQRISAYCEKRDVEMNDHDVDLLRECVAALKEKT